jgi:catechol 2,3-dioxygenase-like lactoylglutathione lyase family enzyme
VPGCGDICFVWEGGLASVTATLAKAGIPIIEGPVNRIGGRALGTAASVSVYVRDPDDNLVEFMCYDEPPVGEQ